MIKIKYIIVSLIIVVIVIIIIYKFNNNISLNTNIAINSMETNSEMKTLQNTSYTMIEIAELLLNKNSKWSDLPLSDSFMQKYNSNDGVLGKIEFDNVEIRPYIDGKYSFEDYAYFVVTQGKKKTAYVYDFKLANNGLLIDDIIFPKVYYLTDENGQELDARVTIDENNYRSCFYSLAWGMDDEQSVAVTSSFHKKYPFFLDIFEHYSPLIFNPIEFVPERSSWERKEAYFIVDSKLECKERHYKVKFSLDSRGYLDDVNVIKVNEEEYEIEPLGWNFVRDHISPIFVLIYPNSNYKLIKSTENFKKKYNNENRILNNIYVKDCQLYDKLSYLVLLDDTKKYYYVDATTIDDENTIDNIVITELPYNNVTFEEAKELYLKEYNK